MKSPTAEPLLEKMELSSELTNFTLGDSLEQKKLNQPQREELVSLTIRGMDD